MWQSDQKRNNSTSFWGRFFDEPDVTTTRELEPSNPASKKRAYSYDDTNSDDESYHRPSKTHKIVPSV